MNRFSKVSSSSGATANAFEAEEYGYALPLGRGIEKMPMPEFTMPSLLDVSSTTSVAELQEQLLTPLFDLAAHLFPSTAHGRCFGSLLQDQDQPRNYHFGLPLQGRYHRRC